MRQQATSGTRQGEKQYDSLRAPTCVLAAGRFGEPVNDDNAYFLKERFGRERKSNCRSAKKDRHYNGVPCTASIGIA
jgi:hypothetical protein